MSQQVKHSLIQVAIMMVLAVLGVAIEQQTSVLQNLGINPLYFPIVGAILASAVRYFEGIRDAERARVGVVVPADVAYDFLVNQSKDPFNPSVIPVIGTENVQVSQ